MADSRVVYGARCTWWDRIDAVGRTSSGLPGCPNCGSPLFEIETEEQWWEMVDSYDQVTPGYRDMISWSQGRCFDSYDALHEAYIASR